MKRKAFLGDMLTYIIVLFGVSIVIITMFILLDKINDAWQADSEIPQEAKDIISRQQRKFAPVWDGFMVVAVIGYVIAIVIAAFSIRSNPVFAMLALIVLIILGVVAVHLSNAFASFSAQGEIASAVSEFPRMQLVMNNLPLIIVVLGLMFIIVLYAKTKQSQVI